MADAAARAGARADALMLIESRGWRVREGRRVAAALAALYPDGSATASRLGPGGRRGGVVRHMLQSGYVVRDPFADPARYRLTFGGRCRALCDALGVSMLGLCIMAESYVTHESQEAAGCPPSYCLAGVADLLGRLYSTKSVWNCAARLCADGRAVPVRRGVVRLAPGTMRELSRAGATVGRLHEMLVGLPYQLCVMSVDSIIAGRGR